MVGIFPESFFVSREFLEMPSGRLCPSFLQALTQTMIALANFLNLLTTERFTLAISGKIDDAQVYPKRPAFGCVRHWLRRINGYSQVEGSLAIDQIGLPLDTIQAGLLVPSYLKGNQDTPLQRQERDGEQSLEGHDPLIVDNCSFWFEGGLDALVSFVDLCRLAYRPNSQLSREFVGGTQLTIDQLLQLHFIGHLFSKCNVSHIVTRSIESAHRLKQGLMLFGCGC